MDRRSSEGSKRWREDPSRNRKDRGVVVGIGKIEGLIVVGIGEIEGLIVVEARRVPVERVLLSYWTIGNRVRRNVSLAHDCGRRCWS